MKLVETKTTKTGTDFEGNRAGCICNGTVAVANSHDAGPHIVWDIVATVE